MQNAQYTVLRRPRLWPLFLLVVVAVGGLYLVKWSPYLSKAFLAAAHHSLGPSILDGAASRVPTPSWQSAWAYSLAYYKAVWQAVILGLLLGAGVQSLVPADWLGRVLGKETVGSTAWAAVAAVPSMMCTCCTAPIAVGMRRRRVSTSAALAYWIGNPMLNPATIVFMGFVLGWGWSVLRVVTALVMVFGISYLATRLDPAQGVRPILATTPLTPPDERNPLVRFVIGFGSLAVRLVPEYVVVVLALGAARAWLFPLVNPAIGHSVILGLWLAIAGTLFVIPTAGEIPIVQVLMSYGLGPFASGALLATLPAVSLPSLIMVGRSFTARTLALVAVAVVAIGVLSGVAASLVGL